MPKKQPIKTQNQKLEELLEKKVAVERFNSNVKGACQKLQDARREMETALKAYHAAYDRYNSLRGELSGLQEISTKAIDTDIEELIRNN
jgi:hypothetical protein